MAQEEKEFMTHEEKVEKHPNLTHKLTKEDRAKGGRISAAKKLYGGASDTITTQLNKAVKQTIKELIEDIKALNLLKTGKVLVKKTGDVRDLKEIRNIKDRKEFLSLISNELLVINRIRELAGIMADQAAREMQEDVKENRNNIRLLGDARRMLADAGIDHNKLDIPQRTKPVKKDD